MRLKHILVPTDFGDSSERAEAAATELATKFDAKITLLHVWSVPTPSYAEALSWPIDSIESAAHDALQRSLASLKEKVPSSEAVLVAGLAWERIIEIAKSRDVDMIVMGTHSRRGVPRWFFGSVAEKVVRLSHVPVLTVSAEKG